MAVGAHKSCVERWDSFSQESSSRFPGDEQTISLISTGHVSRTNRDLELYTCNYSKTLPKRCAQSHDQFQQEQIQRACSQELLGSGGHVSETIPRACKPNPIEVLSSRPNLEEKKVASRPKLSTFSGHTEQFAVQIVKGSRQDSTERYLKPESV